MLSEKVVEASDVRSAVGSDGHRAARSLSSGLVRIALQAGIDGQHLVPDPQIQDQVRQPRFGTLHGGT
jgi:hypothetical protein